MLYVFDTNFFPSSEFLVCHGLPSRFKKCRSRDGPFPMPVDARMSNHLQLVSYILKVTNTVIGSCVHLVPLKTQLYTGKTGMYASLNLVRRPAPKQQCPNPQPERPAVLKTQYTRKLSSRFIQALTTLATRRSSPHPGWATVEAVTGMFPASPHLPASSNWWNVGSCLARSSTFPAGPRCPSK